MLNSTKSSFITTPVYLRMQSYAKTSSIITYTRNGDTLVIEQKWEFKPYSSFSTVLSMTWVDVGFGMLIYQGFSATSIAKLLYFCVLLVIKICVTVLLARTVVPPIILGWYNPTFIRVNDQVLSIEHEPFVFNSVLRHFDTRSIKSVCCKESTIGDGEIYNVQIIDNDDNKHVIIDGLLHYEATFLVEELHKHLGVKGCIASTQDDGEMLEFQQKWKCHSFIFSSPMSLPSCICGQSVYQCGDVLRIERKWADHRCFIFLTMFTMIWSDAGTGLFTYQGYFAGYFAQNPWNVPIVASVSLIMIYATLSLARTAVPLTILSWYNPTYIRVNDHVLSIEYKLLATEFVDKSFATSSITNICYGPSTIGNNKMYNIHVIDHDNVMSVIMDGLLYLEATLLVEELHKQLGLEGCKNV